MPHMQVDLGKLENHQKVDYGSNSGRKVKVFRNFLHTNLYFMGFFPPVIY